VREFRTLGSVRGAARKGGPYRNRGVLPLRVVLHRTAHRPAPGPMGHAEVQATAEEATTNVGPATRCSAAEPQALRSLASACIHTQPACKSRMNREVHVRFRESRGVRFPPGYSTHHRVPHDQRLRHLHGPVRDALVDRHHRVIGIGLSHDR
jgi:hypothetical protein